MSQDTYNPQEIENNYYKIWEEREYFEVEGNKAIQEEGKNFYSLLLLIIII